MLKKLTAVALMLVLLLSAGCGKKPEEKPQEEPKQEAEQQETPVQKPASALNPLTGCYETEGIANIRPVAVMINNDVRAQNAQAGLPEADVVYESEIEGGETRLMAVFQDVQNVKNIGTIRSARVAYVDLAVGHNAVYIHRGCDETYAGPHMRALKALNRIDIHEGNYGERLKNGLALEHTLYTHGDVLWNGIKSKYSTTLENVQPWQNFAKEDEKVTLTGGTANKVTVKFSGNFQSVFVYDQSTGLYERNFKTKVPTEYFTKQSTKVKNVVVCLTDIKDYPDREHRNIPLESGKGYYITNGTFRAIKWSKGGSTSPLKFTYEDGSEFKMSAGNTWVCFSSQRYSVPIFE